MKVLLSFFMVMFGVVSFSAAQTGLDTFYKQGATWRNYVFFKNNFPFNAPASYTAVTAIVENDTSINGKSYHVISQYSDGGYSIFNSQVTYTTTPMTKISSLGIRVDSQKVYRLNFGVLPSPATEELIYDFALTVGDTLYSASQVVLGVDTVYLSNGTKLRKYIFSYHNNLIENYWIEGIGSRLGFAEPDGWMYPPTFTRALCYSAVDGYQYKFPDSNLVGNLSSNCFTLPTDVSEVTQATEDVWVYPSPFVNSWITIKAQKNLEAVHLYDITGKLISNTKNIQSHDMRLLMPQEAGVYLLDIQMTDGTRQKKKIQRE